MLRRTRFGLLKAFVAQYGSLKLSAAGFDFGHLAETARMANAIFILLGPASRNHTSIVESLAWAPTVMTSKPSGALCCIQCTPIEAVGQRPAFWLIEALPAGRDAATGGPIAVAQWWEEVVVSNAEGTLSRLDLIRITRDKEGGAHLDPSITSGAYKSALLQGVGFMFQPAEGLPSQPVENTLEAIIRQLAFEVLVSLKSKIFAANIELQQLAANGETASFAEENPPA